MKLQYLANGVWVFYHGIYSVGSILPVIFIRSWYWVMIWMYWEIAGSANIFFAFLLPRKKSTEKTMGMLTDSMNDGYIV